MAGVGAGALVRVHARCACLVNLGRGGSAEFRQEAMPVSSALSGLMPAALAILASAQSPEQPLLRPVDDDNLSAPEPEPASSKSCASYNTGADECAKNCPIWTDCGKLAISGKCPNR